MRIRDEIERPGEFGPEWIGYSLYKRLSKVLKECRTSVERENTHNHIDWIRKLDNDKCIDAMSPENRFTNLGPNSKLKRSLSARMIQSAR